MKTRLIFAALALIAASSYAADFAAPAEKTFAAPHDIKVSVKMIGPYAEPADLQIVCAFKHKASGDTYLGAMKDLDAKLGAEPIQVGDDPRCTLAGHGWPSERPGPGPVRPPN